MTMYPGNTGQPPYYPPQGAPQNGGGFPPQPHPQQPYPWPPAPPQPPYGQQPQFPPRDPRWQQPPPPYGYQPQFQPPPKPPKKRGKATGIVLGILLPIVLVITLIAGISGAVRNAQQARSSENAFETASQKYENAVSKIDDASEAFDDSTTALDGAITNATSVLSDSADLLAGATDGYVDATTKQSLTTANTELETLVENVPEEPDITIPDTSNDPETTAEMKSTTAELTDALTDITDATDEQNDAADALNEGSDSTVEIGDALVASIPTVATALLAAAPKATNATRLAFQEIIDNTSADMSWSSAVTGLPSIVTAAQAVQASQKAQSAKRLTSNQVAAEKFMRSIAGGPLDFVWTDNFPSPCSNCAYHAYTDVPKLGKYGYSTITLNLAMGRDYERHPSVKAVMAHEVGHSWAGTDKCNPLFKKAPFNGSAEMWATAWAISKGYDRDGSGESLYGRPTDEQIRVAGTCR